MYDQHTLTRQFSNATQPKTTPKRLHLEKSIIKHYFLVNVIGVWIN